MQNRMPNPARGFSLVELLVVLVIIGLLGAIVLPNVLNRTEGAKADAALAQLRTIKQGVETYYLDTGNVPQSLNALVNDPGVDNWNGEYIQESLLQDPWGNDWIYRVPGQDGDQFDLISYGADGSPGGEGNAEDIES